MTEHAQTKICKTKHIKVAPVMQIFCGTDYYLHPNRWTDTIFGRISN